MNQPSSACGTLLNDISIPNPPASNTTRQPSPEAAYPIQMDFVDEMDIDHPVSPEHRSHVDGIDMQDSPGRGTTPLRDLIEEFEGASQSFPGGKTFMDQFFSDEHRESRKNNLFYPFASSQDWQIASWLLRSRLSMAAIDDFLSLDLVSHVSESYL